MNNDDEKNNPLNLQIPPMLIQAIGDHLIERLKPIIDNIKQNDDTILDVKGVAAYMNVDENWVYQRTRTQKIPYIKKGKYCLFRKSTIDGWLNQDAVKPLPRLKMPKR